MVYLQYPNIRNKTRTSVNKNVVKQVNYLNKDFSDFRDNLINFYIFQIHNDFNEPSPGMMFIEMALMWVMFYSLHRLTI